MTKISNNRQTRCDKFYTTDSENMVDDEIIALNYSVACPLESKKNCDTIFS